MLGADRDRAVAGLEPTTRRGGAVIVRQRTLIESMSERRSADRTGCGICRVSAGSVVDKASSVNCISSLRKLRWFACSVARARLALSSAVMPTAALAPPLHDCPARSATLKSITRGHLGSMPPAKTRAGCAVTLAVVCLSATAWEPMTKVIASPFDTGPAYSRHFQDDQALMARMQGWARPDEAEHGAAHAAPASFKDAPEAQAFPVAAAAALGASTTITGSEAAVNQQAAATGGATEDGGGTAPSNGGESTVPSSTTSSSFVGLHVPKSETRLCSACTKVLPKSAFTKNQLKKSESELRCKECVAGNLRAERDASTGGAIAENTAIDAEQEVQIIYRSASLGVWTGVLYPHEEGNAKKNRINAPEPATDEDKATGTEGLKTYVENHDLDQSHQKWVDQCQWLILQGHTLQRQTQAEMCRAQADAEARLRSLPKHTTHEVCSHCGIDHQQHAVQKDYFISTLPGLRNTGEAGAVKVRSKFVETLNGQAAAADVLGLADAMASGHLPANPTAMCKGKPDVEICSFEAKDVLLDGSNGLWVTDENGAVVVLLAAEKLDETALKVLENEIYTGSVNCGAQLLTRQESVAAIGTNFIKYGLKCCRNSQLLMPHTLPSTRPANQHAAGASSNGMVPMSAHDRLHLLRKQKGLANFYEKYVHPIVLTYLYSEFTAVGIFMSREQMNLFARQVTAATTGELFWARTHIDDDVFFSVLVKHATPIFQAERAKHPSSPVENNDQGGDFALPDRGIVIPLQRGNILVYNPRKKHGATEHGRLRFPTSRGCMTAFYVKAACIRAWFTTRGYVHRISTARLDAAYRRAFEVHSKAVLGIDLGAPGVPGKRKQVEEEEAKGRVDGKSTRVSAKSRRLAEDE